MSYLETYCTDILDGRIVACEKMKRQSERLLTALTTPGQYHFDPTVAQKHLDFIETFCCSPEGKQGNRLQLEPFQKAILEATFGFLDDLEHRQYHEVFLLIGRKNGKTTLCSALGIDMTANDGEMSPQVYYVATAKDQARLGFEAAQKMVNQSPLLSKHFKKRASDIYFPPNMGKIKPLASDTNKLDGLNASFAVIDELAAIKNRDLYDLIKQAGGSREQPLLFTITTNGFIRGGIFDAQYQYAAGVIDGSIKDDSFLPFIYELDSYDEYDKPEMWIKANPGLGPIKKEKTLADSVTKAKQDPSYLPTVLVKDFNLQQTNSAAWLRVEDFDNHETFDPSDPAFRYGIGCFDASDSVDLTAAKVITMRKGDPKLYVLSMYWIPQAVLDQEEEKGNRKGRDVVPYRLWVEQGLMRVTEGNRIDKNCILDWFREVQEDFDIYIPFIGYDPWHVDDTLVRTMKQEFGEGSVFPIRQGVRSLSQPMKNLKADLQAGLIVYNDNPVDRWQFFNATVKADINGNIQLIKNAERKNRNDGIAALIDGYAVLENHRDDFLSLI